MMVKKIHLNLERRQTIMLFDSGHGAIAFLFFDNYNCIFIFSNLVYKQKANDQEDLFLI